MFRNEHKKVLCPGVLKTIANSLDQGKTHQLPEVTILVGANHRSGLPEVQQRDPENKTALVGLDKLPHIPGDIEGYAYVQGCTQTQGTGEALVIYISLAACEVLRRHRRDMRKPSTK